MEGVKDGQDGRAFVLRDVVHAGDGRVQVVMGQEGEQVRDGDSRHFMGGRVHPADEMEVLWGAGFHDAFHSREFGGLVDGDFSCAGISRDAHACHADEADDQCHLEAFFRSTGKTFFQNIPGGDAEDERGSRQPAAGERMCQAVHGGRIEDHVVEAGYMGLDFPVYFHQLVSGGSLHPGVGHNDPDGAEMGAKSDHAGGKKVHFWAHLVPAEKQDGQEA